MGRREAEQVTVMQYDKIWFAISDLQDGERKPWTKKRGAASKNWKMQGKEFSPRASTKGNSGANTSILAWWDPV